jgi:hypothetical protein
MTKVVVYDFNLLNHCAYAAFRKAAYHDAIAIYLFLASLDETLEAGSIGFYLAKSYEHLGDRHSAKFWATRAVAENPTIDEYVAYLKSLKNVTVDDLIATYTSSYEDRFGLSKRLRDEAVIEGKTVWPAWSRE